MSNLRNQIAEQTNNVQEVAEDLAERVRDILQPPPRRAMKISTSISALMILALIARFIYEFVQTPTYEEDDASPSTDG